jgi:hypothetical protein
VTHVPESSQRMMRVRDLFTNQIFKAWYVSMHSWNLSFVNLFMKW